MGEILRDILQAFTRYSANDPKFPVNDVPLFTGARLGSSLRMASRILLAKEVANATLQEMVKQELLARERRAR
jgi:hypothetical protein